MSCSCQREPDVLPTCTNTRRIRTEYESKLRELEADRQEAEEGRAQVGRYKAVLLKQRDIMIALTARLNERDETIIRMQVGPSRRCSPRHAV